MNPALIERDARIPDEVVKGLAAVGAFGMKIAPEFGGLGLSNLYYNRALVIVGSASPVLAALLSAHQSIAVPQPLAMSDPMSRSSVTCHAAREARSARSCSPSPMSAPIQPG